MWNYYREEINKDVNEKNSANNRINNNKIITGKSLNIRTISIGSMPSNNNILNAEVVVPLKYFRNVRRSLDLPLIKWKKLICHEQKNV